MIIRQSSTLGFQTSLSIKSRKSIKNTSPRIFSSDRRFLIFSSNFFSNIKRSFFLRICLDAKTFSIYGHVLALSLFLSRSLSLSRTHTDTDKSYAHSLTKHSQVATTSFSLNFFSVFLSSSFSLFLSALTSL